MYFEQEKKVDKELSHHIPLFWLLNIIVDEGSGSGSVNFFPRFGSGSGWPKKPGSGSGSGSATLAERTTAVGV